MEVSLDHPFFVYGQGWASCNPDMSMQVFGLKCQRLQVGDICISLTKRTPTGANSADVPSSQRRHSLSSISSSNAIINTSSPHSAPMSSADMTYSHLNAHAFPVPVPSTLPHPLPAYAEMAKLMSSYAYAKGLPQISHEQLKEVVMDATMLQSLPPKMVNAAFYQSQIYQFAQHQHHHHQQQQELLRRNELKYSQERTPPLPTTSAHSIMTFSSQSPVNGGKADMEQNQNLQPSQTHPLDASVSRKRRWSAPENMFDDDDSHTQPIRSAHPPSSSNALSSPPVARSS